jgi:ferrous iron transport protein A
VLSRDWSYVRDDIRAVIDTAHEAGEKVKVACIHGGRGLCARMAAMGIYPGVEMHLLCTGCVRVNGGVFSLGKDISDKILVTPSP